jgi:ribosome-associated toxin RatA of RatAB toxin-antitoxin module
MPSVHIERHISGVSADEVFAQLKDMERLPEFSENVLKVDVHRNDDGSVISEWEVIFRGGVMRWTELDVFDDENRRFEFKQVEGDLATFDGYWQVEPDGDQVLLLLHAEFDLGMPSLSDMLDPVAARALESALDDVLCTLIAQEANAVLLPAKSA